MAKLNKDMISQKAIEIVNQQGLAALSMRKLARSLHVKAASLYNHVDGKSQLYDIMQEFLYSKMEPLKAGHEWKAHLTELARRTREGLLKNPNMLHLFATRPTLSPYALQQAETTIGTLMNAGFNAPQSMIIFRNLNVFVLGHVLAEVGRPPGADKNDKEPTIHQMNIDEFPLLQQASQNPTAINFDRGFELALQCMFTGLEASLQQEA